MWKDLNIIEYGNRNQEVKNERVKAAIKREESEARSNSSEREQARPKFKSEDYDDFIDLSGRKVSSQLKKGIYIQNGEKNVLDIICLKKREIEFLCFCFEKNVTILNRRFFFL